ncbi:hypothetical protein LF887_10920 [Chryseobacterium sp. MEBOG06]|uniref:hypothetical protein n=1 Tax=Chryseobacterium sp. MEBOG06 TaxID=2879938 RepID=UPI001F177947|nr:hypothetical protein [Chryseobacterium sp. MEBOG06]UKB86107.1 hypothetical protein LF887_10920 [Chryseobacterium sp. MEBOG06]
MSLHIQMGIQNIWEDPQINNIPQKIDNLLNSDDNVIPDMKKNSGTELLPQQIDQMKQTIELV